jgi:hydrogenase maturation protein HypF
LAARLRRAALPGGDAAARWPVQALAGFVTELGDCPDLAIPPFCFPDRFTRAHALIRSGLRTFRTSSVGRLFDTVAALTGFTRPITFEGQAAMWLEHLARNARENCTGFPCRFDGPEIDWRDTLAAVIDARRDGVPPDVIARAFHRALARATAAAIVTLCDRLAVKTVVLSGGVIQNDLFLADIHDQLQCRRTTAGSVSVRRRWRRR